MREGYKDEEPVKMNPEKEAELVKRLKAFSQQPTIDTDQTLAEEDPEMISVSRMVRKKRGMQLGRDGVRTAGQDRAAMNRGT